MARLKINHDKLTPEHIGKLVKICPFGAIEYDKELTINSGCKMCKICVKKGPVGCIEYVEEEIGRASCRERV